MDDNPFESDKNSHKSDENGQVAETTLSTVEQSQSVKRLLDTERMYLRRPRDPDQIMVAHDVTTKFEVVDQNGDAIYYLVQADSCCSRTFCCSNKWFTIDVYDTDEKHVGHFERPIGCLSCWCGCCSQTMRINFPPTKFMGEVIQKWSLFGSPNYQVQNYERDLFFVLSGRNMCGVEKIRLFNGSAAKIGKLKSEWDGLPDNKFASQQCFGLVFPKDLDLEHKNLLIGAAFLMGHNYFGLDRKVTHEELIPMKSAS